jgi:hypothetical protein
MFFLMCAICGMALLCVVGLTIAWLGEANAFVLPNAADVRVDRLSLTHQRLAYHLPANQTLNDVFRRLEQHGWTRDRSAEQALRHDRMEGLGGTFAVFWRHAWFGLLSEAAVVGITETDGRLAEARVSRCFAIAPWTGCL